jgi:hypothetical protein
MQEMRAQVESGAISQDALREAMQGLRPQGAGGPSGATRGAEGGQGTAPAQPATRPGAVFVLGPNGEPEARPIQIGLGDWDNTQVTGDVQEGDLLVIVGAAQMQAQQEAFLEQISERMGGQNPFGGGMPGGGRGFRR